MFKPNRVHHWKLTCPLKMDYFSREYIFPPLMFKGQPLVFGGIYTSDICSQQRLRVHVRVQANGGEFDKIMKIKSKVKLQSLSASDFWDQFFPKFVSWTLLQKHRTWMGYCKVLSEWLSLALRVWSINHALEGWKWMKTHADVPQAFLHYDLS